MNSIEQYSTVQSERQLQIQQCKVQEVQSSVTSSGDETCSGIVSDEEIEKKELEAHYGLHAVQASVINVKWRPLKITLQAPPRSSMFKENKTILKQLKKANASLTQKNWKSEKNLDEIVGLWGGLTSSQVSAFPKFCVPGVGS
ncbi:hypothetical protein Tco_0044999 [Tanacetum coccineum]